MTRVSLAIASAAALAFTASAAYAQTGRQAGQGTQTVQGAKGAKGARAAGAGATAKKKPTTQQEVESSVESGTVPTRYRSSVPKEYQQYIPFGQ